MDNSFCKFKYKMYVAIDSYFPAPNPKIESSAYH